MELDMVVETIVLVEMSADGDMDPIWVDTRITVLTMVTQALWLFSLYPPRGSLPLYNFS